MRKFLVVLVSFVLVACNPMQVMEQADSEIAVFQDRWNDGDVDAIWKMVHPDFRKDMPRDEFNEVFEGFKGALGAVESSKREGFNINTNNGVTTTVITMRTQFANGEGMERFTLLDRGDTQKIVGYFVDSYLLDEYLKTAPDSVTVVDPETETVP